ncbi:hypothetical protein ACFE04_007938 [Oxalis oulophora]
MAPPLSSLVFNVCRREPELIRPATPTPSNLHPLSDIDDQECLRFHFPIINFYRHNPEMLARKVDPVNVIRNALAQALVFYYPFAGRLIEGANRKLSVDCNSEGVLFIEADADVSLEQFGKFLHPPFPCLDELLYDVPGSSGMLNSPLMLIQVTRLKCGGFTFALRRNHTISDGAGLSQFLSAMSELARGADCPSIKPVWERHVLNARDPPHVSYIHHEYDDVSDDQSCLWLCRSKALQFDPKQTVRMLCTINLRKFKRTMLPLGYYGNAFAIPAAISTAEKLTENHLSYAVELVQKAKAEFNEKYLKSVADLMVIKGRPHYTVANSFVVSDAIHAGLELVDFGWGEAVYGGLAKAGIEDIPEMSFYLPYKNDKGNGILMQVCLPAIAMERFVKELDSVLNKDQQIIKDQSDKPTISIRSAL